MHLGIRHYLTANSTNVRLTGYGHFRYEKKTLLTVVTKIRRKNHVISQFMGEKESDETNTEDKELTF